MRVLHINSYYSGSSFYKNLYDKQVEYGLDIDVFVPVPLSFDLSVLLGDYTKISKNHRKYDRILFHLKHYKIYKDIKKTYNIRDYNIIHAHSLFSNGYVAMRLKEEYGVPYIVAVRNTDVNTFFKHMINLRKLGIKILKEAEKIIFLSESYKNIVIKNYVPINERKEISDKVEVIPNGIDDYWFQNINISKTGFKQDKIRLLYAGVINKNKNILSTIKAIEKLRKQGIDVEFTIVGRIEDFSIYKLFRDLPYVKYYNQQPKDKLIGIYRDNDIFVMPSITESFGLVYAEAMSQGLPVIYTKDQGFDKHFKEGHVGYSVDCYDYKEISFNIVKIMNNYSEISNNCLNSIKKFRWDEITKYYIRLYSNLKTYYKT